MKRIIAAILGVTIVTIVTTAHAQLTATVHPGYTFSDGERPSVSTLNQLGTPTIEISGTVSGSVGLSPGSVTGTYLANSVPDNVTLDYNGASPRQLEIKALGVTGAQLSSTLPDNLTLDYNGSSPRQLEIKAGGIANAQVNASAAIAVSKIALSVGAGLALSGGGQVTLAPFSSGGYAIGSGGVMNSVNHGLGAIPGWVRVVLVNTSTDLGYAVGDEIYSPTMPLYWAADATKVYLEIGPSPTIIVPNKGTGAFSSINNTKWTMKIYASP